MASGAASHPFGLSQIPGDLSFRNSAVNAVAVIPLLSTDHEGNVTASKSADSFHHLLTALQRHTRQAEARSPSSTVVTTEDNDDNDELLLVIPNSSLSRPGDWRYSDTPLKAFHWQHGCQRVAIFDGRPDCSRQAHDRLMNHGMTRDWIDLCPSRRTAAVIGVLNMHDCRDTKDLELAEEELHKWAERYATPPYEVTAHGRNVARDQPVIRLFVYDSFDEACQRIDLTTSSMGNSVLAFPPTDEAHAQMMGLHLNVVVNDLAVAIFCDLETKIRESDAICSSNCMQVAASAQASSSSARRSLTRIISGGSSDGKEGEQEPAQSGKTLTLSSMAGLVSPDSKLAQESPRDNADDSTDDAAETAANDESTATSKPAEKTKKTLQQKRPSDAGDKPPLKPVSASTPLLLTPLDDYWEPAELSGRDIDAIRKRDLGRREKFAADLSLLAGSPLDAYERYLKAAELCKSGTLDPLWYASSLEGCASSHIAMAESGGYSIDDYLDNNFQLPDELMALVKKNPEDNKRQLSSNKQTLPEIIFALCEEALNIVNRHPKLASYHAELLLKLAWYAADTAPTHLRCRWGEGHSSYHGEPSDPPRWERTSVYNLQFESFKGDNPVAAETVERAKRICDYLHQATALRSLDPATRVDVASQAIVLCLQGVKQMEWGKASKEPIILPRKAAFFAAVAADAVSNDSVKSAGKLWLLATQLYSRNGGPAYGWGALRAACLSALSTRGNNVLSLEAAEQLLSLLCELNPNMKVPKEPAEEQDDAPAQAEGWERGISELSGHGSSAAPKEEQEGISSTANLFAKQLREGYHQMKSTSTFLAQQSKWAYEDPLPPQELPLGDTSTIGSTLSSLKCVWTNSDLNRCAAAQSQCMNRISFLRRSLPTPSSQLADFPIIYGRGTAPTLPLYVVSAKAIDAESQLEVQKIKVASPKADQGAMATFFNPFEKKRRAGGSEGIASVAEGEERAFSVKFGNRLAVPLEITRCQLEFRGRETSRVKATSLSFIIPPKSKAFTISFPFTVLPRSVAADDNLEQGEEFEVSGVDLTCLGRSFSLPIKPNRDSRGSTSFPVPGSEYTRKSDKKKEEEAAPTSFPIQVYPCQPSLHIFYADSHTPFEGITINLADGELYTSPPLLLECYAGPSGHGNVEQLEIYLSGLTTTNQKLFDTSSAGIPQSNDDFIGDIFGKATSQPLKVRVVAEKFSLSSVNGRRYLAAESDNRLRIQAVASHSMSRRLEKDTLLRLRFRYRGQTNKSTQVWRNHEIPVKIKLSKGPRITCLSFQPDIHSQCFFRELARKLELKGDGSSEEVHMNEEERVLEKSQTLNIKVGHQSSANVCSSEVGVLVTVLNETRAKVKLSRESGPISNLGSHQLEEIIVRPSVSVKIPMLLKRHKLTDHTIVVDDLVDQLVSSTELVWRSLDASGGEAFGQVRVHTDCLKQLMREHPSIVSKVCDPPCFVAILVNGSAPEHSPMRCSLGSPGAEICVKVDVADWVSLDERKKCDVKMELICVSEKNAVEPSGRDHIWAGKVRHKTSMEVGSLEHRARVIFCSPGSYIVSACVRITHELANKGVEEIWSAPCAQRILVKRADVPAQ